MAFMQRTARELEEGEVVCSKCKGSGAVPGKIRDEAQYQTTCMKCFGRGKLDWVTDIMGNGNSYSSSGDGGSLPSISSSSSILWDSIPTEKAVKEYINKKKENLNAKSSEIRHGGVQRLSKFYNKFKGHMCGHRYSRRASKTTKR